MTILQPSYRLESPEVGGSGSGVTNMQSQVGGHVDELVGPYEIQDETTRQTLSDLMNLVGGLNYTLSINRDLEIKLAEQALRNYILRNHNQIVGVLRGISRLSEQGEKVTKGYRDAAIELIKNYEGVLRAIAKDASDSDRSHIFIQTLTLLALLRRFNESYIPNLERAMQSA